MNSPCLPVLVRILWPRRLERWLGRRLASLACAMALPSPNQVRPSAGERPAGTGSGSTGSAGAWPGARAPN